MTGIEIAIAVSYASVSIFGIFAFSWKTELNEYRRNEQAKQDIAENSAFEGKLLKSGGSVHKY